MKICGNTENLTLIPSHLELSPLLHLRHCRGILEDQDQELSQLRPKVQRGRNLAHILQQYLKDVLTVHDPETCTGQGFRRLLTEAVRLSACLEDLLGAGKLGTGCHVRSLRGSDAFIPLPWAFASALLGTEHVYQDKVSTAWEKQIGAEKSFKFAVSQRSPPFLIVVGLWGKRQGPSSYQDQKDLVK